MLDVVLDFLGRRMVFISPAERLALLVTSWEFCRW